MTAVRSVMRGESYLSPLLARETIQFILNPPQCATFGHQITAREAEILQLLTEGRSMKETGEVLGIGPNTVAFYKYRMMGKLGIGTSAELIQYAITRHMTPAHGNWSVSDATGLRSIQRIEPTQRLASSATGNIVTQLGLRAAQST